MSRPITTHQGHLTQANKRHIRKMFDTHKIEVGMGFKVNGISYKFTDLAEGVWTVETGRMTSGWGDRRYMQWHTAKWSWKE